MPQREKEGLEKLMRNNRGHTDVSGGGSPW